VPKLRTGSDVRSAPTAAMCIVEPMSIAAAFGCTITILECVVPDALLPFISTLLIAERKGWAAQSINFLTGIVRRRRHSQARNGPWTMFFNEVIRHQKTDGRSPPMATIACGRFSAHRRTRSVMVF
jgi:hypothetical protein